MKRLYDLGGVITFVLLCSLVFGGKAAIDAVTPDDPPKQEQTTPTQDTKESEDQDDIHKP